MSISNYSKNKHFIPYDSFRDIFINFIQFIMLIFDNYSYNYKVYSYKFFNINFDYNFDYNFNINSDYNFDYNFEFNFDYNFDINFDINFDYKFDYNLN